MKKRNRLIFSIAIVIFFLCSMQEEVVATTFSSRKEVPVSTYRDSNLNIDSVRDSGVKRNRAVLETSYFSPYITSVKNQNPYGSCWTFAYVAASEASLIQQGQYEKDNIDLSELHLAYFTYHSVTDPLGGTAGDGFSILDTSDNAFLNVGGDMTVATFKAANWCGLVDEETAPYTSISTDGNTVLKDEIAYNKDVVHLENAYWISMEDEDIVKQLIKTYGACGASYYSANKYYNTGTSNNWDREGYSTVAVYCPDEETGTNHAITIVGWDDSYSKENFGTSKPSGDGAWYCKNSWGADWGEDGYFWISYEDNSLLSSEAFFCDYGSADNYEHNYQYDGGGWGATTGYEGQAYEANMYKAQGNEGIKAVGFYTCDPNYDCTVMIYKDCTAGNPTSGTLVLEQAANQLYAGFHTVQLDEVCYVDEDEWFSVVIKHKSKNTNATYVLLDSDASGSWYRNQSCAEEGQSFISYSGKTWTDKSAESANCRIKAFTDDRIAVTDLELNKKEATLFNGDTLQLKASITPQNASLQDIVWSSSNPSVATVDENGKVTSIGYGSAIITATSVDNERITAICNISVIEKMVSISFSQSEVLLEEGQTLQMQVSTVPETYKTKGVYWTSSNESVVKVDSNGLLTAMTVGEDIVIKCIARDGTGVKAVCTVDVKVKEIEDTETGEEQVTGAGNETGESNQSSLEMKLDCKAVYKLIENGTDTTIEITDGSQCTGAVKIPDVVMMNGTIYKVTSVADNAFLNNKNVTRISVGKNVTDVGKNAFMGCSKLKSVTLGSNVTTISNKAFYNCTKLKAITIPSKVKGIGKQAFAGCKTLKTITIKTSKLTNKTVGTKAFKGISSKATIKVPKKKLHSYKKLLKKKGIGSKVKVKK